MGKRLSTLRESRTLWRLAMNTKKEGEHAAGRKGGRRPENIEEACIKRCNEERMTMYGVQRTRRATKYTCIIYPPPAPTTTTSTSTTTTTTFTPNQRLSRHFVC